MDLYTLKIPNVVVDAATKIKQVISKPNVRKWLPFGGVLSGLVIYRLIKQFVSKKHYKSPPIYRYDFPIIGSLFTLLLYPQEFRRDILPKYGDIVGYSVGNIKFYKLNDVLLTNKVYKLTANRPAFMSGGYFFAGITPDVVLVNEDVQWGHRRKLLMSSLTATLNSRKVESEMNKILREITYEYLDSNNDNEQFLWYPRHCVRNISFNVIYYSLFNKYYKLNNAKFVTYSHASDIFATNILSMNFAATLKPKFLGKLFYGERLKEFYDSAVTLKQLVAQDYEEAVSNSSIANLGDAGGSSIGGNSRNSGERICDYYYKDKLMTKDMVIADLLVTIQAGMDTTAHTMEIGLLLLAKYPNVQSIIYNELTNNSKNKDSFDLSTVKEFPQFRAFIFETLRLATPAPDGVHRFCDKDIRIVKYNKGNSSDIICDYCDSKSWKSKKVLEIVEGNRVEIEYDYILEKNRALDANIVYMHYNKIGNEKAQELNLNNWLKRTSESAANDKKFMFVTNKNSIPFGVGKRECAGQSLAIKELCAFFGNLLLRYEILAPKDNVHMNFEFNWNSIVFSVKHETPVVVKYRQN